MPTQPLQNAYRKRLPKAPLPEAAAINLKPQAIPRGAHYKGRCESHICCFSSTDGPGPEHSVTLGPLGEEEVRGFSFLKTSSILPVLG